MLFFVFFSCSDTSCTRFHTGSSTLRGKHSLGVQECLFKDQQIKISQNQFKHSVWTKENVSATLAFPPFGVIFAKSPMGVQTVGGARTGVSLSFILHDGGSFTVHSDITVAFYNPSQRFTS